MSKGSPNDEFPTKRGPRLPRAQFAILASSFIRHSCFVLRHSPLRGHLDTPVSDRYLYLITRGALSCVLRTIFDREPAAWL
jgi:hypothetical protein